MELRKREQNKAEIPTASMADVAFLLILFFLVSTIFSSEMGLQIILPEHGEIVKIAKSNIAHVYINEFGAVKIDGEPTEVNLIADRTKDMLVENDSLVFSIKTHPEAAYESMIKVFDKLKHGSADRISFAPRDVIKP